MCSLQCSLHEVIKEEQTRVALDSRVTQHGGSREFLIALIRDDVTKISLNVEPRLGGDHFAWFVDV